MEKNISSNILKIYGGAELSAPLDDEKIINIRNAELTIFAVSDKNNEDGSYTRSYSSRITSEIELEQEGKPIRGSDKTRKSIKLRQAIWALGQYEGTTSEEQFYDNFMNKLLLNLDEVYLMLKD